MNTISRNKAIPRVSVVIVNFNTCDHLRKCLSSIERHHQVIVVDNASSDGSVEMMRAEFPWVEMICSPINRGFGAANNLGMERAVAPFLLLLNSDAYATPGAIDLLADTLESHTEAVACGGFLHNTDGSFQPSTANALNLWSVFCEQTYLEKLFPKSRCFSPYWNREPQEKLQRVAQITGACLMMRPLQRFDENYFLYCEDTDLCHRLRKEGDLLSAPEAHFVHALGSSTKSNPWLAIASYNRGKELFFCLHYGPASGIVCWLLNRVGALLRLIVWALLAALTLGQARRIRRQVTTFARVLTAPANGPLMAARPQPWLHPSRYEPNLISANYSQAFHKRSK